MTKPTTLELANMSVSAGSQIVFLLFRCNIQQETRSYGCEIAFFLAFLPETVTQ